MSDPTSNRYWLELLEDEETVFLKRFVLAGGSLKDLAALYGVSYPTVRLRLDRLIAKVQLFEREAVTDEFQRVLRVQFADGKFDAVTFKRLLAAYQAATQAKPDNPQT